MADATIETDGRRAKRVANRKAVLDALTALWEEGRFGASTNEIAERAGISARSLFRYFDDVDDMVMAASARGIEEARPLLAVHAKPEQPTAAKAAALAHSRVRLYRTRWASMRAIRMAVHRNAAAAAQVAQATAWWRDQVSWLFAPELTALAADDAERTTSLLAVLVSFDAWEVLVAEGRADDEIETTLAAGVLRLLRAD